MIKNTYLTFQIGKEQFAVSVNFVLEVLEQQIITPVPKSPENILGIINFRGQILPVMNMHQKFDIQQDAKDKYFIVIFEIPYKEKMVTIAGTVDSVRDVIEISDDEIQTVPEMGINYDARFIEGAIKIDESFVLLLNSERIFSIEEIDSTTKIIETENVNA